MALNWPVSSPTSSLEVTGARTSRSPAATLVMARDRVPIGCSSERPM
jgi:hypothetical protein